MTPSELPTDTAVAVVFFRPSSEQVVRIVERFAGRLPVFVYDNGGIPPEALAQLRDAEGLTRLGEGRNHGIAAALNALAEAATAAGFHRLFCSIRMPMPPSRRRRPWATPSTGPQAKARPGSRRAGARAEARP